MTTLTAEIQSLAPSALVVLFTLDNTNIAGGQILNFHAGTNLLRDSVIWQGVEYAPLPIEASGFDVTTAGTLPRPKIQVANAYGLMSVMVANFDDLIGAKVIRKRTFVRFLDAVNFPDGNPSADPSQHYPDDLWFVDRKVTENKYLIEWELASAFDLENVMLPGRQVVKDSCWWRYRSAECGWTGNTYFDRNDAPTNDQSKDSCSKRLSGCKCRFGATAVLPFGGFPGAVSYG